MTRRLRHDADTTAAAPRRPSIPPLGSPSVRAAIGQLRGIIDLLRRRQPLPAPKSGGGGKKFFRPPDL